MHSEWAVHHLSLLTEIHYPIPGMLGCSYLDLATQFEPVEGFAIEEKIQRRRLASYSQVHLLQLRLA